MEINKVITAIILTVLLVFGIGKISDLVFEVDQPNQAAYKVDAPEGLSVQASSETSVDISALLAMGDITLGKQKFRQCKSCHSIKLGGGNKIGPALWNVMFRPVGSVSDYKYSKALLTYGKDWGWEEMNGFLTKPSKWIKGNKMGFAGLKDERDRASVILYLNQNSDNPKPLP